MGKYCKAYPVGRLREFGQWRERAARRAEEGGAEAAGDGAGAGRSLTDEDYLFLQEDFTVTDGIFLGEQVVFADTTPEWVAFCADVLKFEVPTYEQSQPGGPEEIG
jgi:hypothetical protein